MNNEFDVLNYVACGMGGPETITERLRATYEDLIQRGLVRVVKVYELSESGEEVLATQQKTSQE